MYDRDTLSRTAYQHNYYSRNKHRKKYTYVKKGIVKKISKAQWALVQRMQKGYVLYLYVDVYRYLVGDTYYPVNTRTVESLINKKYLVLQGFVVRLTEKGNTHKQN